MSDHTSQTMKTLRDVFKKPLLSGGDAVAVVFEGESITFAGLEERSLTLAEGLYARGVRPGARVALLMKNCPEYAISDLAILRLGAVKVPVNEMLPSAQVSYVVNHSGAEVLIVGPELVRVAADARPSFSSHVLLVQIASDADPLEDGAVRFRDLGQDAACRDAVQALEIRPEDGAAIYYTSGTTGRPKGVLHTQSSLVQNQLAQLLEGEILADERLLLTTPLPHASGLFLQSSLLRGARAHVLEGFDPARVLDAIERHRITWTFAVPTMIYRLLDRPDIRQRDLSSLRTIVYGAAPITPERLREALDVFGDVFIQLYAQTECPNWGTRLSKADHSLDPHRQHLLSSCGRAVLMADVRIVDADGATAPVGDVGEICLRAPYVLDRYWDDPEATRDKFVDGWMRTGDIGLMDEAGYVYLRDRTADMIISGGLNVYSTMVEAVLQECSGVREVAVIGIPDADWGEAVHAVIVSDRTDLDEAAVRAHCEGRLASYMRPKSIELTERMPLTTYGKVDKKALRRPYWGEGSRQIH